MQVEVGGLSLEVELHGAEDAPALLLIPGMGMQLVDWPLGLVEALTDQGFCVVRYDPRDVGLSTSMDTLGRASVASAAMVRLFGLQPIAAYTLADLATEAIGLLDALGIAQAHVCGVSMGGMVAQRLALAAPQRVLSMTLMMTSSSSPWLPRPDHRVMQRMFVRPPSATDFEALVAHFVELHRLIGSPGYPESDDALHARVAEGLRRSYRPKACERQAVAVLADPDRSRELKQLDLPCAVIHGKADRLVPPAAGRDLARLLRGSVLHEIPGMGHDLPAALWPRFAAEIAAVAAQSVISW